MFSPDGRLLVSVGEDKRVIVWDFARRERLATLDKHNEIVNAVAFAPNGKWFATMSQNGLVIVWDVVQQKKVVELREHLKGADGGLVFSPDSSLLLSVGDNNVSPGRALVRETVHWERVRELLNVAGRNPVFTPKGRQILDSEAQLWDIDTGRLAAELPPNTPPVDASFNWVALAPDGTRVVGIDGGGGVTFYQVLRSGDLTQAKFLRRERAHHDHGRAIAFSPDGRLLASGAEHIVLWNAATLKREAVLEHTSIVWGVVFSPDGRWLVSTHGDGSILIWNVSERTRAANLNEHSGPVRAVAFTSDGQSIASAGEDRSIIIWNAQTSNKEVVLIGHESRINGVAWSRDSQWLAAAEQDRANIFWDVLRRQQQWKTTDDQQAAYCVALSPDGRWVATTTGVHERATGHEVMKVRAGDERDWAYGHVYGAAFSPDGRRLACATDGGWVRVWAVESWRLLAEQQLVGTHQISISFAPDGQTLVTGEDEGAVRLWRVEPLEQLAIVGRHAARIKSVAFSPDGREVVSASDDKTIALWDVGSRRLLTRIGTHTAPLLAVAFSPDGKQIVAGGHDRSVRLYTRQRSLWGWRWE